MCVYTHVYLYHNCVFVIAVTVPHTLINGKSDHRVI